MFADPFSAVMALILLAFIGTLAVFFRIWRELDALRRALGTIQESLQYHIEDMDQQNQELVALINEWRGVRTADHGPAREAATENLGALLEKGLPNLVGNPTFGGVSIYDSDHPSAPSPADKDEDDFLRRLETSPEKRV